MRVTKKERKDRRDANKAYRKASKMNRKNEKFQQKAAKDRKLVTKKAQSSGDLLKNLDKYDEKKEKSLVKKGLKAMAGTAAAAGVLGDKLARHYARKTSF